MNPVSAPLGSVVLNLGPADRIPLGEGRTVRVKDLHLAVFRARAGAVFVTEAVCPHQGGPLADGVLGARMIVCPLHACGFDLETGRPAGAACRSLRIYPAALSHQGEILVGVD